jgi:hypothetical protein
VWVKCFKIRPQKLGMRYRILKIDKVRKETSEKVERPHAPAVMLYTRLRHLRSRHLFFTCACSYAAVKVFQLLNKKRNSRVRFGLQAQLREAPTIY